MFFHLDKNSTYSIHKSNIIQKYNEVVDNLSALMSCAQIILDEIKFQQIEKWYQDLIRLQNTTKNVEMDTVISHYNGIVVPKMNKKMKELEPYLDFIEKNLDDAKSEINLEIASHNNEENRDILQKISDLEDYINKSIESIVIYKDKIESIRDDYEQRSAFGSSKNKTFGILSFGRFLWF